jgi:hypothetical protein
MHDVDRRSIAEIITDLGSELMCELSTLRSQKPLNHPGFRHYQQRERFPTVCSHRLASPTFNSSWQPLVNAQGEAVTWMRDESCLCSRPARSISPAALRARPRLRQPAGVTCISLAMPSLVLVGCGPPSCCRERAAPLLLRQGESH